MATPPRSEQIGNKTLRNLCTGDWAERKNASSDWIARGEGKGQIGTKPSGQSKEVELGFLTSDGRKRINRSRLPTGGRISAPRRHGTAERRGGGGRRLPEGRGGEFLEGSAGRRGKGSCFVVVLLVDLRGRRGPRGSY
jgi:hypothetical protein